MNALLMLNAECTTATLGRRLNLKPEGTEKWDLDDTQFLGDWTTIYQKDYNPPIPSESGGCHQDTSGNVTWEQTTYLIIKQVATLIFCS